MQPNNLYRNESMKKEHNTADESVRTVLWYDLSLMVERTMQNAEFTLTNLSAGHTAKYINHNNKYQSTQHAMRFLLFLRIRRQTTIMMATTMGTPRPMASPMAIPTLLPENTQSQ